MDTQETVTVQEIQALISGNTGRWYCNLTSVGITIANWEKPSDASYAAMLDQLTRCGYLYDTYQDRGIIVTGRFAPTDVDRYTLTYAILIQNLSKKHPRLVSAGTRKSYSRAVNMADNLFANIWDSKADWHFRVFVVCQQNGKVAYVQAATPDKDRAEWIYAPAPLPAVIVP